MLATRGHKNLLQRQPVDQYSWPARQAKKENDLSCIGGWGAKPTSSSRDSIIFMLVSQKGGAKGKKELFNHRLLPADALSLHCGQSKGRPPPKGWGVVNNQSVKRVALDIHACITVFLAQEGAGGHLLSGKVKPTSKESKSKREKRQFSISEILGKNETRVRGQVKDPKRVPNSWWIRLKAKIKRTPPKPNGWVCLKVGRRKTSAPQKGGARSYLTQWILISSTIWSEKD